VGSDAQFLELSSQDFSWPAWGCCWIGRGYWDFWYCDVNLSGPKAKAIVLNVGTRKPRAGPCTPQSTSCSQHRKLNISPGQPLWRGQTHCLWGLFTKSPYFWWLLHTRQCYPLSVFFSLDYSYIQLQCTELLQIQMHFSPLVAMNWRTFRLYWPVGRDIGKKKGREFLYYTASTPKQKPQ
jgi:hypothetical protein